MRHLQFSSLQIFKRTLWLFVIIGLNVPAVGQTGKLVDWQADRWINGQAGDVHIFARLPDCQTAGLPDCLNPLADWQTGNQAFEETGIWQLAAKSSDNEHHGEHGESHGIPRVVFYQILNFLLFIAFLFFLLKDKIKIFYQNRYNLFQEQFKAARREREDMQASYKDYQEKLQQITATSEDQVKKAEQESNEMKTRMLADADLESQRIKNETQALLDLEHKKAKRFVQAEFVEKVISSVQDDIAKGMSNEDRKSLIKKFEAGLK